MQSKLYGWVLIELRWQEQYYYKNPEKIWKMKTSTVAQNKNDHLK